MKMITCDRCGRIDRFTNNTEPEFAPSVHLTVKCPNSVAEHYDLCKECAEEVIGWLKEHPPINL